MRSDCAFLSRSCVSPRHPTYADLIFDVHFLDDPNRVPELCLQTGRGHAVTAHIERDPDLETFFAGLWR